MNEQGELTQSDARLLPNAMVINMGRQIAESFRADLDCPVMGLCADELVNRYEDALEYIEQLRAAG